MTEASDRLTAAFADRYTIEPERLPSGRHLPPRPPSPRHPNIFH